MFTLAFWKATAERTAGTFAATVLGLAGTDTIGMLSLDWGQIFAASGIIAGLTVLKCVAASSVSGTPSATNAETITAPGKHAA